MNSNSYDNWILEQYIKSLFATCGDWLFKSGNKKFFLKWKSPVNCYFYTTFLLNVEIAKTQRWQILVGQHCSCRIFLGTDSQQKILVTKYFEKLRSNFELILKLRISKSRKLAIKLRLRITSTHVMLSSLPLILMVFWMFYLQYFWASTLKKEKHFFVADVISHLPFLLYKHETDTTKSISRMSFIYF